MPTTKILTKKLTTKKSKTKKQKEGELVTNGMEGQTKDSRYDLGTSRAIEGGSQMGPLASGAGRAAPLAPEAGPKSEKSHGLPICP